MTFPSRDCVFRCCKRCCDDVAAESPEQQFMPIFYYDRSPTHLLAALASALGAEEAQEASKESELVEA